VQGHAGSGERCNYLTSNPPEDTRLPSPETGREERKSCVRLSLASPPRCFSHSLERKALCFEGDFAGLCTPNSRWKKRSSSWIRHLQDQGGQIPTLSIIPFPKGHPFVWDWEGLGWGLLRGCSTPPRLPCSRDSSDPATLGTKSHAGREWHGMVRRASQDQKVTGRCSARAAQQLLL